MKKKVEEFKVRVGYRRLNQYNNQVVVAHIFNPRIGELKTGNDKGGRRVEYKMRLGGAREDRSSGLSLTFRRDSIQYEDL